MQLIKPFELMFFLFQTGINEKLASALPIFIDSPEGISKIFGYGGTTDAATGGELIVKPKFDLFAGRFIARNDFSGYSDTCLITNYQPNINEPR